MALPLLIQSGSDKVVFHAFALHVAGIPLWYPIPEDMVK